MQLMAPLMNCAGWALVGLALSLGAGEARAAVVAVVSASNPVTTLSKNQVADIFLGRATHFPGDGPVVPIDQAEGSAERNEFYDRYADKSAAQVKSHWSKIVFTGRGQPPKAVANSAEVKKRIAEDPNAIGYIEQSLVDSSVRVLLVQ
jgi:ABC-type phosphate transport system substrate-binding protein